MSIPATIADDIKRGVKSQKTHRAFNNSLLIKYQNSGEAVRLPLNSIIAKYKDYFDAYIDSVELTEEEQIRYRYSPKRFSEDMYGTTEYWSMILYINECHSMMEFEPTTIKYIVPQSITTIINEIMILEDLV